MNLAGSGKLMQIGDIFRYPHNGTQHRKTETGVLTEIYDMDLWNSYKSAFKRHHGVVLEDFPLFENAGDGKLFREC